MSPAARRRWFVVFAPITVPVYLLFLAYVNLAAIAFFLVADMTIARLRGRTPAVGRLSFWLLSPAVIVLAAPLLVVHLLIWLLKTVIDGLAATGRWQARDAVGSPGRAGLRGRPAAVLLGAVWCAVFGWCVLMSVDGVLATRLVGREIGGREDYSRALRRRLRLGELPSAMQTRRAALVDSLRTGADRDIPRAALHAEMLSDDSVEFAFLPEPIQFRLVGLSWFFVPAEVSRDGSAHCSFLFGSLLLTVCLMIRWPGLAGAGGGITARPRPARRLASCLGRVGLCAASMAYVLTWSPPRLVAPPRDDSSYWERLAFPARWAGMDPSAVAPPEWLTLNAALWLVVLGAAVGLWRLAARLRESLGVPRYYSAFLAARLLQRKRIAFFSVGAVTLCVAMLLIVMSVMGGFVDTIRARAQGLLGDLVMDGGLRGFPYYAEFLAEIRQWPEVVAATALVQTYGTLRFEDGETRPVQVWGITLEDYCRVNAFCRDLFYHERYPGTTTLGPVQMPVYGFDPRTDVPLLPEPYESALNTWLGDQPENVREQFARTPGSYFPGPGVYRLNDSSSLQPALIGREYPGIIIGRDIVAQRTPSGEYRRFERYPRGCVAVVTMLPLTRSGAVLTGEPPPAPAFRYIDDSRTGIYEIDSKNVYVDFGVLQDTLLMTAMPRADGTGTAPPRCSQMQVKLRPRADLLALKDRVDEFWTEFTRRIDPQPDDYRMMSAVRVSTWEEMQADFINAIKKEKVLVVIMFSVISVVAVFLILCIFYMIVLEKTRDIGIIKSVGGSAEGVAAVFLTYGAAIGIVGAALGSAVGYAFVRQINTIQDWLARLNPEWRIWSPETYSFDKIPDAVKTSDVVLIAVAAVLASIVGAVVPALRAGRTWPVEALRYE